VGKGEEAEFAALAVISASMNGSALAAFDHRDNRFDL
jgi:hypothetical protein